MAAGDAATGLRALGRDISGEVVLPGDESWESARLTWNLAVDQRPLAVVYPESAADVVAMVEFAGEHSLRIAFNAGGHNAGPIDWSKDALLLKTERMRGVEIDPQGRRARILAGTLADQLASAAGEHGLAYLAGTSPDVGVLGYALGGGFSWMIRRHGFACNSIVARRHGHGRRTAPSRRQRPRPGPVLGDPGWGRELRGGHSARARAVPGGGDLRRLPLLADRARDRDPQRLARMDRDRARRMRVHRSPPAAPGRRVPAGARPRPIVRPGRARLCRHRERRPGPRPAAA